MIYDLYDLYTWNWLTLLDWQFNIDKIMSIDQYTTMYELTQTAAYPYCILYGMKRCSMNAMEMSERASEGTRSDVIRCW